MIKRQLAPLTIVLIPVTFLAFFVGVPIAAAIAYTLGDGRGVNSAVAAVALHQVLTTRGLTLKPYLLMWQSPAFRIDVATTAWVAGLATLVVLVLAWTIGLVIRFQPGRWSRWLSSLAVLPLFVPAIIASYALVQFWSDGGFLQAILWHFGFGRVRMPGYTNWGVVIGLIWTNLPFASLLISSGLFGISDLYMEAAQDSGASWPTIIGRILLPMNKLTTIIVLCFTATGALGSYAIPEIMGPSAPQMLGVSMTNTFLSFNQPQQAEVMAMVVFVSSLLFSGLYAWANVAETRKEGTRS